MKIAHEVPFAMLEDSLNFNDYQYILPHLLENEKYLNFMLEYRKQKDSFIIMDNGLFENVNHTEIELTEYINLINPDVFITPDAWNDTDLTWENYLQWKNKVDPKKIMVVIQANNLFEAEDLHDKLVDDGCKYIGLNHLAKFYDDFSCHPHFESRKTLGRIEFVTYMQITNRLSENVHYHLLGCNLASEFKFYPSVYFPEIKTCDTSNPITLAFEGTKYIDGIMFKPKTKIDDIMNSNDEDKIQLAKENINYFKENFIQ
jgi:hypothetical protein